MPELLEHPWLKAAASALVARALLVAVVVLAASPAIAHASFGIESLKVEESTSQAGAHPDVSATFALDKAEPGEPEEQPKSVIVALPRGLFGDPRAIAQCSREDFQELRCPNSTQIGVLRLRSSTEPEAKPATIPLFNLTASTGHVATFGVSLLLANLLVQVDIQPSGQITATIEELPTLLSLSEATLTLTLWGVPADPSHDSERCNQFEQECGPAETPPAPFIAPASFITNPTSCPGTPVNVGLTVTSWQGMTDTQSAPLPPIGGCQALSRLEPTLRVAPETPAPDTGTTQRDTPSAYKVDLGIPQNEEPDALATPVPSEISLVLPPGTSLSPGLATGLQTCAEAQFAEDSCPNASQVGNVEVATPLLGEPLGGAVYIATPTAAEPYRLLIHVSAGPVAVNLTGRVEPDPATGQVTAIVEDSPQLPLSHLELDLYGGQNAVLANPLACGPATSSVQLSTYAPPPTAEASSTFTVDQNGAGAPCPSSSFTPAFTAGATPALAGRPAAFTLGLSREDGQPFLSTFAVHLPPGLTGMLSSLAPCPEPQAAAGTCPTAAQVGTATIAAGAGGDPLQVSGPVYLTGPYENAPFGLAVVIHAAAGPFDLGTAVVRSRVLVDPTDLSLTVASDPLPQIMAGIPLRLRALQISLDRPGFVIDPTTCAPRQISATVGDQEGAQAILTSPFRVTGCAKLRFSPHLTASTAAHGSLKGDGASLTLKILSPPSSTATMRSAIVELPATLRPRLTTIQHACLSTGGAILPSACPPESRIGVATVRTPILSAPLTGAIYLVAHGGANLPTLVMALQGDGVAVQLPGVLSISRHGSISAAFRALPDAPISAFELSLPRGPHSILGAISNPCARAMRLPYELTDQTGAHIDATAHVAVSGCPRARTTRRRLHPRRT